MIRTWFCALWGAMVALALTPSVQAQTLQDLLQENAEHVTDPSRRTVGEFLDILVESGLPEVPLFLETWGARELYQRDADGLFVYLEDEDAEPIVLIDVSTGMPIGEADDSELDQLRPNGGVRRVIAGALGAIPTGCRGPGGSIGGA